MRDRPRLSAPGESGLVPGEGDVFFGCRPWEPKYELEYTRRHSDGRLTLGAKRPAKSCRCGGADALRRKSPRGYCPGCSAYAQQHRLPAVRAVQSARRAPEAETPASPLATRRARRREKFAAQFRRTA